MPGYRFIGCPGIGLSDLWIRKGEKEENGEPLSCGWDFFPTISIDAKIDHIFSKENTENMKQIQLDIQKKLDENKIKKKK